MIINGLNSKVFLAPMAGITDKPMRRLVNSFGQGNIVSEMVAINALSFKNPKTYRIADVRDELSCYSTTGWRQSGVVW